MQTLLKDGMKIVAVGSRKIENGQPGGPSDDCAWLRRFEAMLIAHEPEKHITIKDHTGANHTIQKIADLWDDDVLYEKPDMLLVLVGEGEAFMQGGELTPEEYERIYTRLMESVRANLPDCQVVLMDPYIASPWRSPYANHGVAASKLEKYVAVTRNLSKRFKTLHVATQEQLNHHLRLRGAESIGPDPTNLNLQGHLLIAQALMEALAEGPVETPALKLQDGQTMVWIGDSITDAGRRQASGAPLGYGYVRVFTELQTVREPKKSIHFINRGIGGEVIGHLQERWDADVIEHQPDWLSVKIGINDVNRHLSNPKFAELCGPEKYREIFEDVLSRTKEALPECNILLIDPYLLSHARSDGAYWTKVMQALPQYHQVVRDMAGKFGAYHVKTHDLFQRHMQQRPYRAFGREPVHPNETGVMVIAEEIYRALSD